MKTVAGKFEKIYADNKEEDWYDFIFQMALKIATDHQACSEKFTRWFLFYDGSQLLISPNSFQELK